MARTPDFTYKMPNPSENNQPKFATIDATGLNCPLPILRARQAIMSLKNNDIIKVLATDSGSKADFPIFCKQLGHTLLSTTEENDIFEFTIKINQI